MTTRATGSVRVHHAGLSATRAGTSRSALPSAVRAPVSTSTANDGEVKRQPSIVTGSMRTSSKE